MQRQARTISNSGIYHIMVRGINKEQIFKTETYKIKSNEIIKEIIDENLFDQELKLLTIMTGGTKGNENVTSN